MNDKYDSASILNEDQVRGTIAFMAAPMSSLALAIAQDYIQIQCAWCGISMGFKPSRGATQYNISHGMCQECASKIGIGER